MGLAIFGFILGIYAELNDRDGTIMFRAARLHDWTTRGGGYKWNGRLLTGWLADAGMCAIYREHSLWLCVLCEVQRVLRNEKTDER